MKSVSIPFHLIWDPFSFVLSSCSFIFSKWIQEKENNVLTDSINQTGRYHVHSISTFWDSPESSRPRLVEHSNPQPTNKYRKKTWNSYLWQKNYKVYPFIKPAMNLSQSVHIRMYLNRPILFSFISVVVC